MPRKKKPTFFIEGYDEEEDIENRYEFGSRVYNELTNTTRLETIDPIFPQNYAGVSLFDIYAVEYHCQFVFLCVGRVKADVVAVYELETDIFECEDEEGCRYQLPRKRKGNLVGRKSPLLVTGPNCFSKTNFWVNVLPDGNLEIPINCQTPIAIAEMEHGIMPGFGKREAINVINLGIEGRKEEIPLPYLGKASCLRKEKRNNKHYA